MLAGFNALYSARLYARLSLVYERGRQRTAICTNASNKRDLFSIAVLYSRCA
jgi:hypothetical protein